MTLYEVQNSYIDFRFFIVGQKLKALRNSQEANPEYIFNELKLAELMCKIGLDEELLKTSTVKNLIDM